MFYCMNVYTDSSEVVQFFKENDATIHEYLASLGFAQKLAFSLSESEQDSSELLANTLHNLVELQEVALTLEESNRAMEDSVLELEDKVAKLESKVRWLRKMSRKAEVAKSKTKQDFAIKLEKANKEIEEKQKLCSSLSLIVSSLAINENTQKAPFVLSRKKRDFINDCKLVSESEYYDEEYVIETLESLNIIVKYPLEFFMKFGGELNLSPSSKFDVAAYFRANPDVKDASINSLLHYLKYGRAEGRSIS